ncbi:hypothetical protein [Rhizosphaericola mali]|uniref:hypothetical protein n=1 Tax=Rhizosphaericola mali TaxID=2545455 RepID=UPI00103AA4D6|nr:hypothetical protein [Rhizosphaericola mali]
MNLNQTISIRFWQTKSRNANECSLIYARITINGDSIEIGITEYQIFIQFNNEQINANILFCIQ